MRLSWLCESPSRVEIVWVDPEEDWEAAEAVDRAFRASKIRSGRDKTYGPAAVLDGEVIGGVMHSWSQDHDRDVHVYSFDVAVDPKFRGAGRGHGGLGGVGVMDTAGIRLVLAAIEQYEAEKHAYGDRTVMSLYVVNPKLARFLEARMGFEVEAEYRHGAKQLVRY